MKKIFIVFLQVAIVLLGIGVFAFLLWEPHLEGRNVHATLFEIYFNDLFLACAYAASTLFFVALYQAFKLLGYIRQNELFQRGSIKALRTIRYCTLSLIVLVVGAEAYLFIFQRGKDDIAGGVAIGLFLILVFITVAISATMLERHIQKKFSFGDFFIYKF